MKIVVIGASWCKNSMVMRPRWQEVQNLTQVEFEYYDFDHNPDLVSFYRLQNAHLPACIFLDKEDQELVRFNGIVTTQKLIDTIKHFYKLNQASTS